MVRRERTHQTIKSQSLFVEESYFSICSKHWTKRMLKCVIKMRSRLSNGIRYMKD
uniref:Uncharacterized protein n=1 Tax=Podoviridae sp. ctZkC8 TaxID=2825259 RepID=A0A8S5UBX6_9CAUD|nr:MAG TPA: hypothetical protein [Podoviridae sp. ctZkC8]